ncbi:glutaredoxin family protein [Pseudomonas neustonica]|uniref:Glutaredoxin family protein n=1 Tax=Pseudomonas neustonica TaxID=2487346 RepID=A0ABX9XE87_9PSED|nr:MULTISPECIES: glutaredoxin family protein [Pseudomonas]MAB25115.1 glutaredoxin [Pseudomonadales bacterium]MBA6419984.1 glutaredoxin family protein [Pseudomonas sp. 5Ae-yellow]ROZ80600.1 glutaredoxin family protein [Pseudomonas sp. SSM44]ROZ81769.1 glutaredoxin family protein [Pseudomonas neustonica]|tara:strand:+ start:404 stop:658 length:255 start_codon:yes stop_codon:yes gene_type:complete
MIRLTLYGTSACHLCDAAMAELAPLKANGLQVREVDIVDAEELMTRYQLRIPVLRREDTGAELDFPFDLNRLLDWLQDVLAEEG